MPQIPYLPLPRCARYAFAGALLCMAPWLHAARAADVPAVAVASDLQYALPEIAAAFTRATGLSVRLAFGSSGNFTHQIMQGAPFEMFFSADQHYVRELAKRSLTVNAGRIYATGQLVLYAPKGSTVKPDPDMNDLAAAVSDGRLHGLAIANPEHAPYGRAARAALKRKGIWGALKGRLVLGENISQAAQFALSGSVQAGLIARALVVTKAMKRGGSYALLPQHWYPPLRQRMVLLRGAGRTARRFFTFAQSAAARAVFEHYGFSEPPRRR